MKLRLSLLTLLLFATATAQHNISGTMSPPDEYKWIIVYRLKPGSQNYIVDGQVSEGKFSVTIPADAQPGVYRLVYAVPQEEFNFDVIYSGEEDIELQFNTETGAQFTASKENILYNSYVQEIQAMEQEISTFFYPEVAKETIWNDGFTKMKTIQQNYEQKTEGMLAQTFITANTPYIPKKREDIIDFIANKKAQYLAPIDYSDATLQSSTFLTDKTLGYIFTAISVDAVTAAQQEQEVVANISTVAKKLDTIAPAYKTLLFQEVWEYATLNSLQTIADEVYTSYIKPWATESGQQDVISQIELHNRLRLGAMAPEITWEENNTQHQLSTQTGNTNYVLVFWSSTCGHCLNELPKLQTALNSKTDVKVIAVGLEDDTYSWDIEKKQLSNFTHVLSLGKWDSDYANVYDIHSTPTYYVLDTDKKIVSKPESYTNVLSFLEK